MEREVDICFKGFRVIVCKNPDMVENCDPVLGPKDISQFETIFFEIIEHMRYYAYEIHMLFRNEPTTELEKVLKDTFQTFDEFYNMKKREWLMNIKERIDKEKVITKTLSKRQTLKKKGYTWVKGKGAIKRKVYSHPSSKYNLRSTQNKTQ